MDKVSKWALSALLVVSASCGDNKNLSDELKMKIGKEVYQTGSDKYASWAYVGFVPRVGDPSRVKLIASKRSFTLRAEAKLTRSEIENYANYLVQKAQKMEEVKSGQKKISWGGKVRKTAFTVYETKTYAKFLETVRTRVAPYQNGNYQSNLALLKSFFPEGVYEKNGQVILNLVYPITTGKPRAGRHHTTVSPRPGTYTTWHFEERRTSYKGGKSHIFGGFPAMWFNGNIGFHGPIRYSTKTNMKEGAYSEIDSEGKAVSKRWQLVRKPDSANCFRMEHHMEVRHLLPAEKVSKNAQPKLQKVKIIVTNEHDKADINGDGIEETIGVKYYWTSPDQAPNEASWKATYYPGGTPSDLYEFDYRKPQLVQIKPSGSSYATMAHLNRLPL